jgi:hypothetical protein
VLSRLDLRREQGFLLVDVLTAGVLTAMLVASAAALLVAIVGRNATMTSQAVLGTEGRSTLDTLGHELQSALCNGSTAPITSASGTQISFTAPDRQLPFHLRQITYTLIGGALTRQVTISTNTDGPPWTFGSPLPVQTVVDAVTNSTPFQYYDSSGTDLSPSGGAVAGGDLSTIAKVVATLTLVPPASRGTGSVTTQNAAMLRTPGCGS